MTPLLTMTVTKLLAPPNVSRGRHWRHWYRDTQDWATRLHVAGMRSNAVAYEELRLFLRDEPYFTKTGKPRIRIHRRKVRRAVRVVRAVPSKRNFIHDRDNLAFCVKPLNDALKHLTLIFDDSDRWLDQQPPEQIVSETGEAYTRIVLGEP